MNILSSTILSLHHSEEYILLELVSETKGKQRLGIHPCQCDNKKWKKLYDWWLSLFTKIYSQSNSRNDHSNIKLRAVLKRSQVKNWKTRLKNNGAIGKKIKLKLGEKILKSWDLSRTEGKTLVNIGRL